MSQKKLFDDRKKERLFEVISLDAMNGFEFQQFVGYLFNKLGVGIVEEIRQVRDAGQDVRIRSPDGDLMIIECKHHPQGTIGRPTVQKLHSAVISANAKKGFVVTTGRFSNAAINYARNLSILIELMDSKIIYDMANRARIRLLKKGEKTFVFHVIPPSQELIEQKVIDNIIGSAKSHPFTPDQLAKTNIINIFFTPAYQNIYSLNEDFSTSVGRIHKIRISRDSILINGSTGELLDPRIARMVTQSSMVENWIPQEQEIVSSGKFKLGYTRAKQTAIKHIRKRNTKTVRYYGANNVRYTKTCVPHISKILIKSLTQVYAPILTTSCSILKRSHQLILCGNKNEVDVIESDTGSCELCNNKLEDKRLLCNSCGRVTCHPGWFGHSYVCEICDKTICKKCAYWTRKYLLFKKKLCKTCSEKLNIEGKKTAKFEMQLFS